MTRHIKITERYRRVYKNLLRKPLLNMCFEPAYFFFLYSRNGPEPETEMLFFIESQITKSENWISALNLTFQHKCRTLKTEQWKKVDWWRRGDWLTHCPLITALSSNKMWCWLRYRIVGHRKHRYRAGSWWLIEDRGMVHKFAITIFSPERMCRLRSKPGRLPGWWVKTRIKIRWPTDRGP